MAMRVKIIIILLACLVAVNAQGRTNTLPAEPNETCQEAWTRYQKADKLWKVGWGLFGSGICIGTAGALCTYLGAWNNHDGESSDPNALSIAGITMFSVGAAMTTASIPCLIIGQVRRKQALNEYSKNQCSADAPLSFVIRSSQNGIGLAMLF